MKNAIAFILLIIVITGMVGECAQSIEKGKAAMSARTTVMSGY